LSTKSQNENLKGSDPPVEEAEEREAADEAQKTASDVDKVETDPSGPPIVGIGSSAGGLAALEKFLDPLPVDSGIAFVVVQHLSPHHESELVELLQNHTPVKVLAAENDMEVKPNHVYVIPPNRELSIENNRLHLNEMSESRAERATIDLFFRSLAEACGRKAAGVVLSGTGSDGSLGLKSIKEHGGLVLVQDPAEADYGGMPRSAAQTGLVDFTLPARELAERLLSIFEDLGGSSDGGAAIGVADEEERGVTEILQLLRGRLGNDFAQYKRATVLRRISRRMQVHRLSSVNDYLHYIDNHPEELRLLYHELLISVTNFFRDPEVWKYIEKEVVPDLFAGKSDTDQLRVWVPGCATGEEAYSIAILLHEYADRTGVHPEIKIFATDINEDVIQQAREGSYTKQAAADLSPSRLQRFFVEEGTGFRVIKELRNDILFAVQNVLEDPPFSDIDLISCRNLLIYLKSQGQKRLLETFHYALRPGGTLLLGSSETVSAAPKLFKPEKSKQRIYRATNIETARPFFPGPKWSPTRRSEQEKDEQQTKESRSEASVHQKILLDHYAPPSVLVDSEYDIIHIHGQPDPYVRLAAGRPTRNLMELLVEELRAQVRTMLFRVAKKDRVELSRRITLTDLDEPHMVQVEVHRHQEKGEGTMLEVSFRRLNVEASTPGEVEGDSEMEPVVEQLQQELGELRERLRVTVEEYETANEELKASNEELLSMNEELQSTTEELETSKEELQSMNEELTTVNEELNSKIEQLDSVNNDLKNLLSSTDIGTIFLDRQFRVKRFTDPVTDYVNLLPADRNRPFKHVTHELESDTLLEDAHRALEKLEVIEREVKAADERWFLVRTLPYRTLDDQIDGVVITFIDMTRRKEAERRLVESEKRFRTFFESASDAMFVYALGEEGPEPFDEVNGSAADLLGTTVQRLKSRTIGDIVLEDDSFSLQDQIDELTDNGIARHEVVLLGSNGREVPVEMHSRTFELRDTRWVVAAVRDMTGHKRYQKALIEAKERAEELAELRSMFLSTMSHEVRSPLTAILSYAEVLSRQVDGDAAESVARIQESGKRLRDSLDTVLQMARMESRDVEPDYETVDLAEVAREAVEIRREQANRKGLEVSLEADAESTLVETDRQFVRQILGNLIDNAIKYTEEGFVRLEVRVDDRQVELAVCDSGAGISEHEQERIFERFERAGDSRRRDVAGVGLGLSITGLLVDALGGEIDVESAENEGSTFRVRLPRRRSQ
jgi:two-component system CheB/CheR fusion protein